MSDENKKQPHDSALGMDKDITRRDFMNATLLTSGGAALTGLTPYQLLAQMGKDNWTGYGGVGDYAESHGNTFEVMSSGHQIRDHVFANPPRSADDTGEVFDFVIVGGGLSGLGTAHYVKQHAPHVNCLVLENHPIFGGEAKQNDFIVDGHKLTAPQGSDHFGIPRPGTPVADLYASIGVDASKFEYQTWQSSSPEIPVVRSFEDIQAPYGLFFGASFGQRPGKWLVDPWTRKLEGAPMSEAMKAEILKYRQLDGVRRPSGGAGAAAGVAGRPAGGGAGGNAKPHELDAMTMEEYMIKTYGLSQETIRKFLTPGPCDGHGLGPDVVSAYAGGFGEDPMNIGAGGVCNRSRGATVVLRATW